MAVKIGTTDIGTVGKIKLGTTNINKVYVGTVQIFPTSTPSTYDYYLADKYECGNPTSIGTELVAFPSGTLVSFSKYYNNPTTQGSYSYRPISTATVGTAIVLNTTEFSTLTAACTI